MVPSITTSPGMTFGASPPTNFPMVMTAGFEGDTSRAMIS